MRPVKKMLRREKRREEISELLDPKAAKRMARAMDNALIDVEELTDQRYEYARSIYKLQDEATRKAIDLMVEKMHKLAGPMVVKFQGVVIQADEARLQKLQERNLSWCAIRLFVACAVWDIQIANFKLPEDACAKCGIPT